MFNYKIILNKSLVNVECFREMFSVANNYIFQYAVRIPALSFYVKRVLKKKVLTNKYI